MDTPLITLLIDKNRPVITVSPDLVVADAVREMNQNNIGALVVLEDDQVVGIFTERDVLVRVVAENIDPVTTVVRKVMTEHPVYVTPDLSVEEAMLIVTEKRFRHLPVLENGRLAGLISSGDLTRWVVRDQRNQIDDLNFYITDTPANTKANPL